MTPSATGRQTQTVFGRAQPAARLHAVSERDCGARGKTQRPGQRVEGGRAPALFAGVQMFERIFDERALARLTIMLPQGQQAETRPQASGDHSDQRENDEGSHVS